MAKGKKNQEKGNVYDRIFRENAEHLFLPLIEQQLGLTIVTHQALPSKLVKTSEREVDFLYQVQLSNQEEWLLHLEFQSKNDPKMLLRMQEYHGRIMRKYDLPIRHVVIYLGEGSSSMKSELPSASVFTGFDTISLQMLSAQELLSSQVPEVVLLALLSNYKMEQTEKILRSIVKRLKELTTQPSDLQRYINQLLVLSRLRHLESITTKLLLTMPITYDIEKDSLYQKGVKKGLEQVEEKVHKEKIAIAKEMKREGIANEVIARFTKLTLEEVEQLEV